MATDPVSGREAGVRVFAVELDEDRVTSPIDGVVSEVAEQAEFTPRDVHMPDERTRLASTASSSRSCPAT